ncbi:ABC transporter substrate-binding protein, partial [bacterium]|nr:ABC transporter substrate-binding protein [bacterium]
AGKPVQVTPVPITVAPAATITAPVAAQVTPIPPVPAKVVVAPTPVPRPAGIPLVEANKPSTKVAFSTLNPKPQKPKPSKKIPEQPEKEPAKKPEPIKLPPAPTPVKKPSKATGYKMKAFFGKEIKEDFKLSNKNNEIMVNSILPVSGSINLIGRDFSDGMNLVFNKTNQEGGINKKVIRLNMRDDGHENDISDSQVRAVLKKHPLFIGNFNSGALTSFLPVVKDKKMAVLFPMAGDVDLRREDAKYMVHLRPSIEDEIDALLTYAIRNKHSRKIAVFYEENQWGDNAVKSADKVIKRFGIRFVGKSSYPQNSVNVTQSIKEMDRIKPNAILCIGHYRPVYNLVRILVNKGHQNTLFLAVGNASHVIQRLKKARGIDIVTSSVVPNPDASEIPLVQQYRQEMKKFFDNRTLSQFSLEGYIAATIFVDALKKAGSPPTLGGLLKALESYKQAKINGFPVSFNEKTRTLSSTVWVNPGADKKWEVV